jgi:hypothetical protein
VGPIARLDGCGKFRPNRDSIPGPSSQYRVAIPTELFWPFIVSRGAVLILYLSGMGLRGRLAGQLPRVLIDKGRQDDTGIPEI